MLVNAMLFLCVCGGLAGLILMVSSFLTNTVLPGTTVETVPRTRDELSEEIGKLTKEVATKSFIKGFTNPLGIGVETSPEPQIKLLSRKEFIERYPIISGGPYRLSNVETDWAPSNTTMGLKPGDQYSNSNGTFTVPYEDQGTLLYNPKTDEIVLFVETVDLFHGKIIYPDSGEGEYLTWKTLEVLLDEGYQLVGEL